MKESIELRRPSECPKCGSTVMKRIFYGRPMANALEKITRGEGIGGGCFVRPWLADWHCSNCRHEWFDEKDPAKQEMECLLARIITNADKQRKERKKSNSV